MTHSALQPRRARTEPLQSRSPANFCIRLRADLAMEETTGSCRPTRDIRRDCLLDSSDVLLTTMTSFEFCATTARTGIIWPRFFDLPKGGGVFQLLEIQRPRWVSHSGSVFVD